MHRKGNINAAKKFCVAQKTRNYLSSWITVSFSRGMKIGVFALGNKSARSLPVHLTTLKRMPLTAEVNLLISVSQRDQDSPVGTARLVTCWTVPGGEIFRTRPALPWGPPSLLYNGYRVFTGGKTAGEFRWDPPPSRAQVEGRVELYICTPSGPS